MKKRSCILFVMLIIVVGTVFAQVDVEKYDLNRTGDGVIIRSISGGDLDARKQVQRIVIPSQIEGFPVVEIGSGVNFRKALQSNPVEIVLPNTIKIIGSDAFSYLNRLTTINLPSGLKEIGDRAFSGCEKLSGLVFPEGLEKIGESAFENCSALTHIKLPSSLTEIGKGAFAHPQSPRLPEGPRGLVEITIPNGIEVIREQTFYDCTFLKTVNLPENLRVIEKGAFFGCKELTDISIPESITGITFPLGRVYIFAFKDCGKLRLAVRQKLINLGYSGDF